MQKGHPSDPTSNVSKFTGYAPEKYTITDVSLTVRTDEGLTPGRPPCLTQQTIGKYLQPLTRELSMIPPAPTISELTDKVIDQMTEKDKAFWVDKPGANAYTLHDAYANYGMTTEIIKPTHQDVFPRSYQYDLDCVRYRRTHACDGLKAIPGEKMKKPSPHCRDCTQYRQPGLTPFQLAWAQDAGQERWRYYPDLTATLTPEEIRKSMDDHNTLAPCLHCCDCAQHTRRELTPFLLAWAQDAGQERWRYYPDLTATLTPEEIRKSMNDVGRPFQNEACNWYYKHYPSMKYDVIIRKFSQ